MNIPLNATNWAHCNTIVAVDGFGSAHRDMNGNIICDACHMKEMRQAALARMRTLGSKAHQTPNLRLVVDNTK